MLRLEDVTKQLVIFIFILIPLIFLNINQGTITIERPYHIEYKQCLEDYKNLEEAQTPLCPECECKETPSTIIFSIIGGLIMGGSYLFMFWSLKQIQKEREKLDKEKGRNGLIF